VHPDLNGDPASTKLLLAGIGQHIGRKARAIAFLAVLLIQAFVPVRHLYADEHADHDDDEVEPHRRPVLGFDVTDDAAEEHGSSRQLDESRIHLLENSL